MTSTKKLAMAALLALGLLALFAGPASAMKYSLSITHPEGLSTGSLNANGVATDSAGNVYVGGTNKVEKFSSTGKYLSKFTLAGTALDVDVDPTGNVWVNGSGKLYKFNSAGTLLAGPLEMEQGTKGIAVDSTRIYWVGKAYVTWLNLGLTEGSVWLSAFYNEASTDIDVDSSGRIWTGEAGNLGTVRLLDSTGKVLSSFGFHASAVAGDGSGNVWLNEPGKCRVTKYTSAGKALEGFGECTVGNLKNMKFFQPGMATGPAGVMWVANGTEVQKWIP